MHATSRFYCRMAALVALLVAACFALSGTFAGAAESTPILQNGNFAAGDATPASWSLGDKPDPHLKLMRDTTLYRTAPASARLDFVGGAAQGSMTQNLTKIAPTFTFSGYQRYTGKVDSVSYNFQVFNSAWAQVAWITSEDNDANRLHPSADWALFSRQINLPADAAHVVLYLTVKAQEGAKFWFADISAVEPPRADHSDAADGVPVGISAPVKVTARAEYRWANAVMGGVEYATGMITNPKHPELLYSKNDTGGFYRLDRKAQRWIPMMDSIPWKWSQLFVPDSFTADANNTDIFYVATGGGKWGNLHDVIKTKDGGKTWMRTNLRNAKGQMVMGDSGGDAKPAGERIVCDPNDSNTIFYGTRRDGMFVSHDAAKTWQPVAGFPTPGAFGIGITFVVLDWKHNPVGKPTQRIYAGVYAGKTGEAADSPVAAGGVYRSSDGGRTWVLLASGPDTHSSPMKASVAVDGSLWVSFVQGAGVWKYSNDAWQDVTPAEAKGHNFAGISTHPTDPKIVIATETNDRSDVYYTADAGATWRRYYYEKGNKPTGTIIKDWDVAWTRGPNEELGGYCAGVFFDPIDPKTAYHFSFNGVNVTHNMGEPILHMRLLSDNREQMTCGDVVSPSAGAPLISGVWDVGGFRHEALDKIPDRIIPLITRDGHGNWGEHVWQDCFQMDVQPKNPDNLVSAGGWQWNNTGDACYSNDNARTWHEFPTKPFPDAKFGRIAISLDPNNVVWAPMGTKSSSLYFTKNNGVTWQAVEGAPLGAVATEGPWSFYKLLAADRVQTGWFYLYDRRDGRFYRSQDGGAAWKHISRLPSQMGVHFDNNRVMAAPGMPGVVFVSIKEKGLFRSMDAGATWTQLSNITWINSFGFGIGKPGGKLPALYVQAQIGGTSAATEQEADAQVYRSDDLGDTWVQVNDVSKQFAGAGSMAGDAQKWGRVYIVTGGRGIFYGEPK